MFNILVTDEIDREAIDRLRELDFNVVEEKCEECVLGDKLKNFDAVITRAATNITKEVIDKAYEGKRLKLILRAGVGVDNIAIDYANKKGIKVINTPLASTISVAELTIAQMIVIARFINISNVTMRAGKWEKKYYKGVEINGKTLGIIGLGRIGKEVAKRADALGMKVIYYDILGKMEGYGRYKFCNMDELLRQSDFITLHTPYNPDRGFLITNNEINKMKDGAYLINYARGGLVKEQDLLEALNKGKISGAALDVFEKEPTPNMELINHPRVSSTPHIGASTKEAQDKIGKEIVNIIVDYFIEDDSINMAL
ncbi:MAG: D-2-hydroxyacid dehydrogenase [Peptostreptococcaceae bacterium]